MTQRICSSCHGPLPDSSRNNRRFCDTCRLERSRTASRLTKRRLRRERKIASPKKPTAAIQRDPGIPYRKSHPRDPLKRIGDDYLWLKGIIE